MPLPTPPVDAIAGLIVTATGPKVLGKRIANLVFVRDSEASDKIEFRVQCEVDLDKDVARELEGIIAVTEAISDPTKRKRAKELLKVKPARGNAGERPNDGPTPNFLKVLDHAVESQKDKKDNEGKTKRVARFEFIRHSTAPDKVEVRVICDVTLPPTVSFEVEKYVMVAGSIPEDHINKARELVVSRLPRNVASDFTEALKVGFQNQRDKG